MIVSCTIIYSMQVEGTMGPTLTSCARQDHLVNQLVRSYDKVPRHKRDNPNFLWVSQCIASSQAGGWYLKGWMISMRLRSCIGTLRLTPSLPPSLSFFSQWQALLGWMLLKSLCLCKMALILKHQYQFNWITLALASSLTLLDMSRPNNGMAQ